MNGDHRSQTIFEFTVLNYRTYISSQKAIIWLQKTWNTGHRSYGLFLWCLLSLQYLITGLIFPHRKLLFGFRRLGIQATGRMDYFYGAYCPYSIKLQDLDFLTESYYFGFRRLGIQATGRMDYFYGADCPLWSLTAPVPIHSYSVQIMTINISFLYNFVPLKNSCCFDTIVSKL